MNAENGISIGERATAVAQTIRHNRNVWMDLTFTAIAAYGSYYLTPEGDYHLLRAAGVFGILAAPLALLARPMFINRCNEDRRVGMGSDDYSEVSDERFLFGYLIDAWKTGRAQLPNSRLRHTEGFYFQDR